MKFVALVIPAACGLLFCSIVAAADTPPQKPGLWETRMQQSPGGRGGDQPHTLQVCIDPETLAHGKQTADDYAKKNCSKNETHHEGAKWISDMVCKAGKSTMSTHSVTEFSGENAYHTQMTMSYDPPLGGRAGSTTTVDGKWLGACKPAA